MSFRLGSIPVRVRGSFLFIALVIASNAGDIRLVTIAVAVVFVSVLVHELGHALVGRLFGLAPQIELHGMGGTTSWATGKNVGNLRSIAISLAGPFAGFVLCAGVTAVLGRPPMRALGYVMSGDPKLFALEYAFFINLYWGVFNLLPMLPLDGGNVMRSALMALTKGRAEKLARAISVAVAGLILVWAIVTQNLWMGVLSAMWIWANVQAFRQADQRAIDLPLAQAIEKAHVALDAQDGAAALALLEPVLVPNAAPELRQLALRLSAYAYLLEGDWARLVALLDRERALIGAEELARYAKTAREIGRREDADKIEAMRAALPPAAPAVPVAP